MQHRQPSEVEGRKPILPRPSTSAAMWPVRWWGWSAASRSGR